MDHGEKVTAGNRLYVERKGERMRLRPRGLGFSMVTAAALLALAVLPAGAAPRVLIVSVDGLRADAVTPELMPFLDSLRPRSATTFTARSLHPTYTIPNHVSMLTGLTPQTHGILELDDPGDTIVDGTILEIAHDAGLSTALYISKMKLRLLSKPGTCDRYLMTDDGRSDRVVDALLADLAERASLPDLAFIHLLDLDEVGHEHGWMSAAYKDRVREVDAVLARIFDALAAADVAADPVPDGIADVAADAAAGDAVAAKALSGETVVLVVSDHGGYGSNHNVALPEVTDVPWFTTGPGIKAGHEILRDTGTHDIAPTALRILGLPIPAGMEGSAPEEIFVGVSVPLFRRGDVDVSGTVNLTDAIGILTYLFQGGSLACEVAADADASLDVDLTDPVFLLEHLFRSGAAPSAPHATCGTASAMPPGLSCSVPCR